MEVQPIIYLEHLTDDEIAKHECSDRIWLPRGQFEYWTSQMEPGVLSVLRITNSVGQSVVGTPFAMHHNTAPATIYIPQWMLSCLECDYDSVRVERISPGLCTQITIQPYTSEHLQCDDPLEALRDAFENYSCIQAGSTIPLWIGTMASAVKVDVNSTSPSNTDPLCIRNGTLDLELLRPLDYPITPMPRPPTPIPPEVLPILTHEVSPAAPVVQPLTREERRNRAAAAAMARMNASTTS